MATVSLPRRSRSSISQSLKVIEASTLSEATFTDPPPLDFKGTADSPYQFKVAATRSLRQRAYQLAYQVYRKNNFVPPNRKGLTVTPFDSHPDTFTLLATEGLQGDAATVTLIFDSSKRLPGDKTFGPELQALRRRKRKLVEVTRLALDPERRSDKSLLVRLFCLIYIYARFAKQSTDFIIEVNPRHVGFYQRLFGFEVLGEERNCPRVNGAPAVLLIMNFEVCERRQARTDRKKEKVSKPLNGLISACQRRRHQEVRTALELLKQDRPISAEECLAFGIPITQKNGRARI